MFTDSYMDSPSVVQRLFYSDWLLIKHYFFSQFYNYKKNKSLQIKAFIVNLNPDTDVLSTSVSFITRYKLMNYTQKTSS
jgi:hypothetical protein